MTYVALEQFNRSVWRRKCLNVYPFIFFWPVCRFTSSVRRDAIIWPVRSAVPTSATAAESATDTSGLNLSLKKGHIPIAVLFPPASSCWLNFIWIPAPRFFGDHTSNLSVFGCKYRYLPDKPHLRRFIRGSVCGKCHNSAFLLKYSMFLIDIDWNVAQTDQQQHITSLNYD